MSHFLKAKTDNKTNLDNCMHMLKNERAYKINKNGRIEHQIFLSSFMEKKFIFYINSS